MPKITKATKATKASKARRVPKKGGWAPSRVAGACPYAPQPAAYYDDETAMFGGMYMPGPPPPRFYGGYVPYGPYGQPMMVPSYGEQQRPGGAGGYGVCFRNRCRLAKAASGDVGALILKLQSVLAKNPNDTAMTKSAFNDLITDLQAAQKKFDENPGVNDVRK